MRRQFLSVSAFFVMLSLSANTLAQTATVSYRPDAAIPALGTGMLFLLGILLCLVGFVWLRRHPNSSLGKLAMSAVGVGVLTSVISGGWLVGNAQALANITTYLLSENPNPVVVMSFPAELKNDFDTSVHLTQIDIVGCPDSVGFSGTCQVGASLFMGGSCTLDSVCDNVQAGPLAWGIESEYQNAYLFAVDKGSSVIGSQTDYQDFCASRGMSVPNDSWPANSCTGGGAVFNSSGTSCPLHQTAQSFFFDQVVPAFPGATYDNILILQGNSPGCWAHNAEVGSMYAFGGEDGSGFSFCRGGDIASKQYHIYVCKSGTPGR